MLKCIYSTLFVKEPYFLQQSVEKASKAFGLYSESISPDELKTKISHNSKKVFTRSIDSLQKEFNKISDIELVFGEFLGFDGLGSKLEFSNFRSLTNSVD